MSTVITAPSLQHAGILDTKQRANRFTAARNNITDEQICSVSVCNKPTGLK